MEAKGNVSKRTGTHGLMGMHGIDTEAWGTCRNNAGTWGIITWTHGTQRDDNIKRRNGVGVHGNRTAIHGHDMETYISTR